MVINCRSMKTKHFSLTLPLSHTEQTHALKFRNVPRYSEWLNTMDWISLGWFLVAELSFAATFAGLHHSSNHRTRQGAARAGGQGWALPWERLKNDLMRSQSFTFLIQSTFPLPWEWQKGTSFPWDKAENFPAAISWGSMCGWSQLASQIQVCIQSKRLLMRIRSLLISCC